MTLQAGSPAIYRNPSPQNAELEGTRCTVIALPGDPRAPEGCYITESEQGHWYTSRVDQLEEVE